MTNPWEGVVEEVEGEEFSARLMSPDGDEFCANFDIAFVDESKRHLIEPGAGFTLNLDQQRVEMIEPRPLTEAEIEQARKWARKQMKNFKKWVE